MVNTMTQSARTLESTIGTQHGLRAAKAQQPIPRTAAACIALALAAAAPAARAAVSDADILNDAKTTGDVVSYGMGVHQHRFSPLNKINTTNVKSLVPAWSFSFGGEKQRGQQTQPIVY